MSRLISFLLAKTICEAQEAMENYLMKNSCLIRTKTRHPLQIGRQKSFKTPTGSHERHCLNVNVMLYHVTLISIRSKVFCRILRFINSQISSSFVKQQNNTDLIWYLHNETTVCVIYCIIELIIYIYNITFVFNKMSFIWSCGRVERRLPSKLKTVLGAGSNPTVDKTDRLRLDEWNQSWHTHGQNLVLARMPY